MVHPEQAVHEEMKISDKKFTVPEKVESSIIVWSAATPSEGGRVKWRKSAAVTAVGAT